MSYDIVTGQFCSSWFGTYEVEGSAGDTYHVTLGCEAAHCTCQGFAFRRECRHVKWVLDGACCWNCQWHDGNPEPHIHPVSTDYPATVPDARCPNCGGAVVPVRIAV